MPTRADSTLHLPSAPAGWQGACSMSDCLDSTIHLKQKEETNESTGKCRIRQYVHDL